MTHIWVILINKHFITTGIKGQTKVKRIITLTTDFGMDDHYVGSMKGVILGINNEAILTDITHDLAKYDIFKAAFTVQNFYKFFPNNSIHVVVVDPGVGSSRKPILIQSEYGIFIGPDNGVFSFVLEASENANVYEIINSEYMLDNISNTFHGRDIFAPVAAHISLGVDIASIGEKVNTPVLLEIDKAIVKGNEIVGDIIYTDSFGNLITNITADMLQNLKEIRIDNFVIDTVASSYQDIEKGKLIAIIGSSGFLELSVNQGSASNFIKSQKVTIKK